MRNEKIIYLCYMRKHNGMRPQDIAILLKIIAIGESDWRLQSLSDSMSISLSEISESLNRSRIAGLIDYRKEQINRQNLFEFLIHGIKYVFPAEPGSLAKGIPTAHSHEYMKQFFKSEMNYVWREQSGNILGIVVEPFYKKQVEAVKKDDLFYKIMALSDVIRVGRVREQKVAIDELKRMILNEL